MVEDEGSASAREAEMVDQKVLREIETHAVAIQNAKDHHGNSAAIQRDVAELARAVQLLAREMQKLS